jgi:hypothetical protein
LPNQDIDLAQLRDNLFGFVALDGHIQWLDSQPSALP